MKKLNRKDVVKSTVTNKRINLNEYACEFAMWLTGNFWIPTLQYPQTEKFLNYKNTSTDEIRNIKELEQEFRKIYKGKLK